MFIYYNVRPLSQERIPEAFPMVAFLDERVTPQQWSDYASTVVAANGQGGGHGIMTLQDRQSHIIGLSVYHIRPDLQRGRVLVIENFAVVTLAGAQQAASTLLAVLDSELLAETDPLMDPDTAARYATRRSAIPTWEAEVRG